MLDHNHHLLRDGQILLADKGFSGKKLTESMALRLLRPERKDETYRNGNLGRVRQWIESVNRPSKANSASNSTADAPQQARSPASPSG